MARRKKSATSKAVAARASGKRPPPAGETSLWLGIVFEAAPDALLAVDQDGLIAQSNRNVEQLLGYTPAELQGKSIDILIPVARLAGHGDRMKAYFANPTPRPMGRNLQLSARRKDGSEFPVDISLNTLTLDGRVFALTAMRDITAQKESENIIRRSEERFSRMFNSAPIPITLGRVSDGRLIDVNDHFCRISGYSREETVGRTVFELNLMSDSAQRKRIIDLLNRNGSVRDLDVTLQTRSGEERSLLYSAEIVEVEDEPCILASAQDITERKAAEESLRRSEERFSKAFNASGDAITISRMRDGVFLDVNQGFLDLTGYSHDQVIGRTSLELNIWADDRDRAPILREIERNGCVRNAEIAFRSISGDPRVVLFSGDRIVIDGEECILAVAKEISDRKMAEEELIRSAQRFRHMIDGLPNSARVIQNGKIVFANTASARLYGLADSAEMLGEDGLRFIAEGDHARLKDYGVRRLAGDTTVPSRYETTGVRSDGSGFPMEISVTVIDYEGAPATLAIMRDLTERQRLHMYESILPVCSTCGKVRDDSETEHGKGDWNTLEQYISDHTDTALSHTFCPVCLDEYRESQGLPRAPQTTKH